MSDIVFKPWGIQKNFLNDKSRNILGAAGKRGGKTEVGSIKSIMLIEEKSNYVYNGIDPYIHVIIAPTTDMLRRLSLAKFMAYAKPFITDYNKTHNTITWYDGSLIYGISGDKPQRIEGIKAHSVWCDEIFQLKEELFLELRARTADTEGSIICTGSLGVQYVNPKQHWAYKHFKKNPDKNTVCYEWRTIDNPHFPRREAENLKNTLDEQTYRAMFEISWDINAKSAVYNDWSADNEIENYIYNPNLELYITVDWGWAHPCAVGFYQYDRVNDVVYKFDEIVKSKTTLDQLWAMIVSKPFIKTITDQVEVRNSQGHMEYKNLIRPINVTEWACDIAGDQHKEQTGLSNIRYFHNNFKVTFRRKKSSITHGISLVRSYIKTSVGTRRFFVDKDKCPRFVDAVRRYRYPEKDGNISNENPIKVDDDEVDETRYFFINFLDRESNNRTAKIASFI